jgi:hypothetical protein
MHRSLQEKVGWAAHAVAASVEHVGIEHGRFQVAVPEELLDGADVVALGQEVGRKAVAKAVQRDWLGDAGPPSGVLEGALHGSLVEVVAALAAGDGVVPTGRSREDVLPAPLP